jgi:hypothetical protein
MLLVGFLIALANLGGVVLAKGPSTDKQPARAPLKPAPDPNDFLPQRTWGQAPAKQLLHLGLLAAIAASDAVPALDLRGDKKLKRDLQKYQGASGFMTWTTNVAPPCPVTTQDSTGGVTMPSLVQRRQL